MSLENVIAENTQAINNLAELIRQAMHMMPPTAPAPVTPQAAPDNGACSSGSCSACTCS